MGFMPSRKPVAMSSKSKAVSVAMKTDSAVVGDNSDLMSAVAGLWIKSGDVIADVTFGRGVFWRKLQQPDYTHDLAADGVDCRKLPHDDESLDCVVIDPPYRPSHGSKGFDANEVYKAYGLGNNLNTIDDVLNLYESAIQEAFRVLKAGGRVFVKCQDMSYANRLHLVTLDVLRFITESGFDLADQFILIGRANLSSPVWVKQERARRSHSVMWVGMKI